MRSRPGQEIDATIAGRGILVHDLSASPFTAAGCDSILSSPSTARQRQRRLGLVILRWWR